MYDIPLRGGDTLHPVTLLEPGLQLCEVDVPQVVAAPRVQVEDGRGRLGYNHTPRRARHTGVQTGIILQAGVVLVPACNTG